MKNNPNQFAVEARKQICDIQQKRMDEEFLIDTQTVFKMFDEIIQEAIDKSKEL